MNQDQIVPEILHGSMGKIYQKLRKHTAMSEGYKLKNPFSAAQWINEVFINQLEMSISQLAAKLGLSKAKLMNVLEERVPFSPEFAMQFEKAFNTPAHILMGIQRDYDTAQNEQSD